IETIDRLSPHGEAAPISGARSELNVFHKRRQLVVTLLHPSLVALVICALNLGNDPRRPIAHALIRPSAIGQRPDHPESSERKHKCPHRELNNETWSTYPAHSGIDYPHYRA